MDLLTDPEAVKQELVRGQELVRRLRTLLGESTSDLVCDSVDTLMKEISGSFTKALNAFGFRETGVVHPDLKSPQLVSSPSSEGRREQRYGKATKDLATRDWNPGGRRSKEYSSSWRILSATPHKDGHLWKKYGQKTIHGAKFPRSYFRCSQSKDQGCHATKLVQRTDDDTSMFQVTYKGRHSCTNILHTSELILDSSSPSDPCLLNFELDYNTNQVQHLSSSSFTLLKQECNGEMFPIHRALPKLMTPQEPVPTSASHSPMMGTGYIIPSGSVAVGSVQTSWPFAVNGPCYGDVDSGLLSSTSSHTSDINSMVDLLDSVVGFCSGDNWNFILGNE